MNRTKPLHKSLALKIFLALSISFVLVMILQSIFLRYFFNRSYLHANTKSFESEFTRAMDTFIDSNNEKGCVFSYSKESDNPVLVFTSNWEIADDSLFNGLSRSKIKMFDGANLTVFLNFIQSMENVSGNVLNIMKPGRTIEINAVRLGNSSYYEPLILGINNQSITNRDSVRQFKFSGSNIHEIDGHGWIESTNYVVLDNDVLTYRSELLYEEIKDILIYKKDIDISLKDIESKIITDSSANQYKVFSYQRNLNDQTYNFITMYKLTDPSTLGMYLSNHLYVPYIILFIIISIWIWRLTRWLSLPVINLRNVTSQMVAFDFSCQAQVKSSDEMGHLADNINVISENLEGALSELHNKNIELEKAASQSRMNEERLKVLLADLAHEFKTPLGIISGFNGIIENGIYKKDLDYYFRTIDEEINKMADMVDEVTELSKLTSGYWPMNFEEVSLTDITLSVIEKFEADLICKGYEPLLHLEDIYVLADGRRIEQVLNNLIKNAMQHGDENKYLSISVSSQCDKNALVEIINSGNISLRGRSKIWQRYQQDEEGTGTALSTCQGIGLEIVRNILLKHQSQFGMWQKNGNVCFYFTLEKTGEHFKNETI